MKQILIIFLGAFLLGGCNSPQTDNPIDNTISNTATAQVKDSSAKDNSPKAATSEKVNRALTDPFRDIDNFDNKLDDPFIDSVHALYAKPGLRDVDYTLDVCIGDNCESWKTIINKQENTALYLFKGDGGEYGFSNDQFLLKKDSLVYARNFTVGIEGWPTDSTATKWKIKEVIYRFQGERPSITTRTVFTKDPDHFDFTLRGAKAEIKTHFDFNKTYKEKSTELAKLLAMKDSSDRY